MLDINIAINLIQNREVKCDFTISRIFKIMGLDKSFGKSIMKKNPVATTSSLFNFLVLGSIQ